MADADTLQMLDGLKDFISSEPWDLSFLDEQSFTSQNFGHGISKTQQNDDIFGASFGGVPQLSGNQDRKRKRGNSFDLTTSGMHRASQRPRSPAVVVYDAKGHKRGDNFMVDRHVLDVEPEDIQRPQRTMEDMKRARAVLSMLPGVVAILRYACGCKSRQGTCNHYSFSGGLALPDGLICGTCRNGAAIQEIKTTRKCPPHKNDEFRRERQRLRRLGYSEEVIEMDVPHVPDFIQDLPATDEQKEYCKSHLHSAMAGMQSTIGPTIKSWSSEQRRYHSRQQALLRNCPMIYSGERFKW